MNAKQIWLQRDTSQYKSYSIYCSVFKLYLILQFFKNSLMIPKDKSKTWIQEEQKMQWSKEKGQTLRYKVIQSKLKIDQHETHWKPGVNSGAPGRYTVPAPHITLVTNLVISHQRGKDRIAITTNGTYRYTFIESIKHALTSSNSYNCILLSKYIIVSLFSSVKLLSNSW